PFNPLPAIAFKQIVLIIVVWFVILRLISKGLKQVSVISAASKAAK
ncbi:TPA_asm: PrsW family intramembrane metalloprotease, partial [Listeria monocytogenes]|nr:PrsW family intramembrane metalloprotease [Listeria monocytogenes]